MREGGAPSEEDFAVRGGNVSHIYVDFMIGSVKIDVNGALADGALEPVMRSGEASGLAFAKVPRFARNDT